MVATSVGITAQVLSARGLLHELSSKIILAAAVIDDVQGLLVLAVVSSLAKGKLQIAEITHHHGAGRGLHGDRGQVGREGGDASFCPRSTGACGWARPSSFWP